jgi:hypothetical protein
METDWFIIMLTRAWQARWIQSTHSAQLFISMIKLEDETGGTYSTHWRRSLRRPRHKCEGNTKTDITQIWYEDREWI